VKEAYLAVAGRIRQELQELEQVVARTEHIWQQAAVSTDDYYVDATALNLHSFYAGLEHIFEIIAEGIDRVKPVGANWHQELLRQIGAEIPSVRPAVLSSEMRSKLDRYRGFRHVVRNVYTFHLDPEQIEVLVRQLPSTAAQVAQELAAFASFLERTTEGE
jgi:hypothetical protein